MKTCFGILLMVLLQGNVLAFAREANPEAEALCQKGVELMQQGNFQDAEDPIRQAISIDPFHYQYHFELANLYAAMYDRFQQNPGNRKYEMEALRSAQSALKQTVMLKPDFVPAHFNLGVLYKNSEDYELAREQFKEVLRYQPREARAHIQIGEVYERQGFFDEARESYRKAKELDFGNPSIDAAIQDSFRAEAEYDQEKRSRDRSGILGGAQGLLGSQNASPYGGYGNSDSQAQGQSGSSLTSLGVMLAQALMKPKESSQ